ncbi:MAG: class I SAM-dependent methyltransferase [Bacteroidetes bacterium]|nr:class I SAM-dependent methyltransferase [Bacteroidota bacterium]
MEYPNFVAHYYDVVYDKVLSGADKQFYLKQILQVRGPVLEIGVGTGRFFTEALSAGANIYGIDISQSMIDVLKKKIDRKYHDRVSVQDMVNMKLDKRFHLILAAFRVLSHITQPDDQVAALNKVYDHLEPGGIFIFDLYVPSLKMLLEGLTEQVDFEGEYQGKPLKRVISMHADLIDQISYVTMTFILGEGGNEKTETWSFPMRFYFRYEIEHLVHRSELTLKHIYGDFSGKDLVPDSREFVVVCSRE